MATIHNVSVQQLGQYLTCETSAPSATEPFVDCQGSSIPDGEVAIVIVELSLQSVQPIEVLNRVEATASNSIDDFFNNFEVCLRIPEQPGSITGRKMEDVNGNGVIDQDDVPVEGWIMEIPGVGTAMTDQNGVYTFGDLPPGDYTVNESSMNGWVPSNPMSGSYESVTVTSGTVTEGIDFLNFRPGSISGRKIHDLNGNGVIDDGEPGLEGWTITTDTGQSAVTDTDGGYFISGVPPGLRTVSETAPEEGWVASNPVGGTQQIDLLPAFTAEAVDFLNYMPGEIGGWKWQDDNGDGEDNNEPRVAEWPITLQGPSGTMQTTTDGSGIFLFTSLPPGPYTLSEGTREGWSQSFPGSGSYEFDLVSGDNLLDFIFGNIPPPDPPGKIHGRKIFDLDGDGVQDPGETGFDGVTIELRDAGGALVATQTTQSKDMDGTPGIDPRSETGWFWFENVPPGQYSISEVVPSGLMLVSPVGNSIGVTVGPGEEVFLEQWFYNKPDPSNYHPDWGDLPDPREGAVDPCPVGSPPMCYATLAMNFGPLHLYDPNGSPFVLGEIIDAESDGQPDELAFGDDENDGTNRVDYRDVKEPPFDDEDGLVSVSVNQDGSITMEVFVTDPPDDGAFLDVWIDLNDDGHLADVRVTPALLDEQVFFAEPVVDGLNTISSTGTFDLLPDESIGYLRMRLSSYDGGLLPFGPWIDGEVEDYWEVPLDFGDAPNDEDQDHPEVPWGYPTTLAQNGASHAVNPAVRLGERIDEENNGQPTTPADGDDMKPTPESDDEDGVRFGSDFILQYLALGSDSGELTPVPAIIRGTDAMIEVSASVSGYLNAWADWNRDGDWDDDGEQMFNGEPLNPGENELDWSAPEGADIGYTFARFRFTPSQSDVSYDRHAGVGEVEDYIMRTLGVSDLESTADTPDADPGDGVCADSNGMCTFRAAIMESNAGDGLFVVDAEALGKSGAATLTPQSPYPAITGSFVLNGNGSLEIDGSQAGVDANGLTVESSGVWLTSTYLHSFDGDGIRVEGDNNVIFNMRSWDNGGAGINVVSGLGNLLRTNSITGNAGLGIDLGDDGVTDNDAGDDDDGPNGLQNHPVLTNATVDGLVEGSLGSMPDSDFVVDFFTNPACDDSGSGQGMTYLGSIDVTTDGAGQASFSTEFTEAGLVAGEAVTATATNEVSGTSEFSACFSLVSTAIERSGSSELPDGFRLSQNYPNPFNPVTAIEFAVPQSGFVRIDVFDVLGKHVARVVNRQVEAGEYTVRFDASALPSGTYVYRMSAGQYSETRNFTVLK